MRLYASLLLIRQLAISFVADNRCGGRIEAIPDEGERKHEG
jgi:hypothetical protein